MLTLINVLAQLFIFLVGLGIFVIAIVYVLDRVQKKQAIRRNFPVIGRFRYWFEHLGEFFRQYFFALDREEMPFNRAERSWVYRAAKGENNIVAFGSTRDLRPVGTVIFVNCAFPTLKRDAVDTTEVTLGPFADAPYTTQSVFHISGMSYGAISKPAVLALSNGARQSGIWMNTGEGGLAPQHLESGADLVFQIGTAKYGVRDAEGNLSDERLAAVASHEQVRMFEIKLSQGAKPGFGGQLMAKKVTGFSMHLVPRTTLAQKMDALSSQSNIAGYKAVLVGASHIGKYMPLLMTAAGTIQPAKVLIIGAGVAGLQAIATAKRLGSQVEAFDVRPVVKEQVESLGAKFVEVPADEDDGVGEGGYAKETSDEYKQKQAELLKVHIAKSDLVITTALIPGRPAPKIITEEMVNGMHGGSAIMDLASENGGNCELTKPGEIYTRNGVIIDGLFNIPGTMPIHASQVYSKNVSALVNYMSPEGKLNLDIDDEIISGSMFTHNGEITDERTADALKGDS